MKQKTLVLAICVLLLGTFAVAQDVDGNKKEMDDTKAADYSKDHESIDSILKATYAAISGAKGEKRDWARFEALFHPGARLIPTRRGEDGGSIARASTPAEYRKGAEPFFDNNGFYEMEIARKTDVFGNIAQVFSTYAAKRDLSDEKPFLRGINSFQLLNDGKRWWVLTIYWQAESDDTQIPEKYLKTNE